MLYCASDTLNIFNQNKIIKSLEIIDNVLDKYKDVIVMFI